MAVIAIVECVVLILTVALSGVFTELDAEAFRFFESSASERLTSLDDRVERLISNTTNAASAISIEAQALAEEDSIALEEAYRDDALYNELTMRCTNYLLEFLNGNSVSSAFFIMNGSNANKDNEDMHSGVFIRNAAPGVTDSERRNLQLEVGPIAVAREHRITAGNRWRLDMNLTDAQSDAFYTAPMEACVEDPKAELVRYGYWSPPNVILPNSRESISYTMPLRDKSGMPWGIIGFEISVSYFTTDYLTNTNLPYKGSFYAVLPGTLEELSTSWIIPGSPAAAQALPKDTKIPLRPVDQTNCYETSLGDLGKMYCTADDITMYSKNSPFADDHWHLVGMVEQNVLNEASSRIAAMLLTNMAIMLGVAFVAIFALTFLSSRKIVSLSQYVNELGPGPDISFPSTDLREIDDLTSAIERLSRRINESLKVTSKMMELTQLPLGGFEVADDLDTVMLTEYIYSLLHLKQGVSVTKKEWKKIFDELTSHPAEGYSDVYRYDASRMRAVRYGDVLAAADQAARRDLMDDQAVDDLYHYTEAPEEKPKWLRIIEAPTDSGTVGMILDATADVDEVMRLAHELDYDALTHLYNRTAFKREAFKKIMENPDKIGVMIFSDLDNLKRTNDTYGHQMGDKLITTAASMFREFADYGGLVARISGDEFAMFLYGFDSREDLEKIVRRLYRGFRRRYFLTPDGEKQRLSCSSGLAWYPKDSRDVADLLKISDYAMYEAKHNNKGTLYEKDGTLFELDEESYMENEQTRKNREDLKRLIDEGLVRFRYQPIVDMETGEIYGYEAFMNPEVESLKTPGDVLAAARAESMLDELENALILRILADVQKHRDVVGDRKIFINSIPGQRLHDDEWNIIQTTYADIMPNIVFEVTEAENNDLETMLSKLRKIRKMGIPIAIDDFGQGYQNEVRIIAMQPSMIKIDLELIRNMHADPEKQRIVSDLVTFAHSQGVKVSAEGVELEQELETVIRFGFDYAQGFLLGRPKFEFQQMSDFVERALREAEEEAERERRAAAEAESEEGAEDEAPAGEDEGASSDAKKPEEDS